MFSVFSHRIVECRCISRGVTRVVLTHRYSMCGHSFCVMVLVGMILNIARSVNFMHYADHAHYFEPWSTNVIPFIFMDGARGEVSSFCKFGNHSFSFFYYLAFLQFIIPCSEYNACNGPFRLFFPSGLFSAVNCFYFPFRIVVAFQSTAATRYRVPADFGLTTIFR